MIIGMLNFLAKSFMRNHFRGFSLSLRYLAPFIPACFMLAGVNCHADIFRYVDEEGVICFTDCPKKRGAVRIIKDRKKPRGRSAIIVAKSSPETTKTNRAIKTLWNNSMMEGMALPVNGRITSTVGLRIDPIDGLLRFHNGIDIAVPEGTPIRPVAPGRVYFSGSNNGYGNMVIITHDDGMITIYAHNSINLMKAGERVGRETTIALSGSTGRSTGPHLHFEAWKNGDNITEAFLGQTPSDAISVAAVRPRRDIIRTSLQADGSILFTNLP